jgi:molybdopterin adenylyltransferase
MTEPTAARIGILTASDRASRGEYEDRSGPAIHAWLDEVLTSPFEAVVRVVPDERPEIEAALCALADDEGCSLVITSGGTGPAPRDVTPEATLAVIDRELAGFGERMRAVSVTNVPTAILSRQTAGTRGRTLILNLPGSPKAIGECLDAVFAAVPDCVDLIGGPRLTTDPARIAAWRPHDSGA